MGETEVLEKFPYVMVDMGAVKFMCKGANVMRPGIKKYSELNDAINQLLCSRLYHYQKLFLSRIKNKPQLRYEELIKENPEIFKRVPHHYIASYLGITPVSLSRIRNKAKC